MTGLLDKIVSYSFQELMTRLGYQIPNGVDGARPKLGELSTRFGSSTSVSKKRRSPGIAIV